jgi:competence protein ComEA
MINYHTADRQENLKSSEKLSEYIKLYKVPLILVTISIIFLSVAAVLLVRESISTPAVVFTNEASDSAEIKMKVDIEGSVIKPGVYDVAENTRIQEIIDSAGGLSKDADFVWVEKYLNKAAKVTDGGKIYIPSRSESEGKFQISNSKLQINTNDQTKLLGVSEGAININTASKTELDSLPGVGEVILGKIISNRPYNNIEELKAKKAVGSALYEKIKNLITVY